MAAVSDNQDMNIPEIHGGADVMISGLTVIPPILKHVQRPFLLRFQGLLHPVKRYKHF